MPNQDINLESSIDFIKILKKMEVDLSHAPSIYRPSKFWEKYGEKNKNTLLNNGFDNFKRTVNQYYSQSLIISITDIQFRSILFLTFKKIYKNKAYIFSVRKGFTTKINDFKFYNRKSDQLTKLKWHQRLIYKWFIYLLYINTLYDDKLHFLDKISEPLYGNPVILKGGVLKDKYISQDLCNSVREANHIFLNGKFLFNQSITITEIGAGYGRLAFVLLSNLPNSRYVVVDIPPALAICQQYLMKCFPKRKFFTYQHFDSYNDVKDKIESSDIVFLLPHQLEMLPDKSSDVIINISSFDEMRKEQIHHWFKIIDRLGINLLYIKGWLNFYNREDNITISCIDYPFRPEWEILSFNVDKIYPKFFEASYKLSK